MRWLMIALLVSVVALLAVSAGIARHIRRAHRAGRSVGHEKLQDVDVETEEAP